MTKEQAIKELADINEAFKISVLLHKTSTSNIRTLEDYHVVDNVIRARIAYLEEILAK